MTIARTYPRRCPIAEENKENVAKAINGKVVRKPAHELERLRSFLIVGINGPTPVIVGLRQKDKRTMAKNKSQLVWVLLLLLFMDVYK